MTKYLKNPEPWFWVAAFVLLIIFAPLQESFKIIFVIIVGAIWLFITAISRWKTPSLIAFIMFLAAWVYIWKFN